MPTSPHTLDRQVAPLRTGSAEVDVNCRIWNNRQHAAQDTDPICRWDCDGFPITAPPADSSCCDPDLLAVTGPAPKKRSTGLLMSLVLAVALVGAIVILFAVAPWFGDRK